MAGEHEWILLDAYECPTASATISAGGDAPNMSHGTEYYVHFLGAMNALTPFRLENV